MPIFGKHFKRPLGPNWTLAALITLKQMGKLKEWIKF